MKTLNMIKNSVLCIVGAIANPLVLATRTLLLLLLAVIAFPALLIVRSEELLEHHVQQWSSRQFQKIVSFWHD